MESLDERKSFILRILIEEYILLAEPVGSKFLVSKYELTISPATIRHEMGQLEAHGYLFAPHPSSGRIPTEKGYEYYLEHFLSTKSQPKCKSDWVERLQQVKGEEQKIKELAKVLADLSGEMVIVAFDPHWSYYTGVSQLFRKPDFADLSILHSLSDLLDQCDGVITRIFDSIPNEPQIFLGKKNPFGKDMATIITRYTYGNIHEGILGLLGPIRMNYATNMALVEHAQSLIHELY